MVIKINNIKCLNFIKNKLNNKIKNQVFFIPKNREELDKSIICYYTNKEESIKLYGIINYWDVSKIYDMSKLFNGIIFMSSFISQSKEFYEDISDWNVSHVKYMKYIFTYCKDFGHSVIEKWNISNVKDKELMFEYPKWNISNISNESFIDIMYN